LHIDAFVLQQKRYRNDDKRRPALLHSSVSEDQPQLFKEDPATLSPSQRLCFAPPQSISRKKSTIGEKLVL
jgi:hypothetical protein